MPYMVSPFDKKRIQVKDTISLEDAMYQGNADHYFSVGLSALNCIHLGLLSAVKNVSDIKRVLDFPCGYGRVMRMIKAAFPSSLIHACDLEKNGVDFCSNEFDSIPVYSNLDVSKVIFNDKFDLIWCGSLFTHIDVDNWFKLIDLFNSILDFGGVLIFTTHGRYVANQLKSGRDDYGIIDRELQHNMIRDYEDEGFGYCNYFHSDAYGISLSSPYSTLKFLANWNCLRVVCYTEKGWDSHQDVVVCVKES